MQLPTPRKAIGSDPPRSVPDYDCRPQPMRRARPKARGTFLATVMASLLIGTATANAAEAVLAPGDAVVSGFSGFRPSGAPMIPGTNPLDRFVINVDGASAQIQSVGVPGEPPSGQLVATSSKRQFLARDVGQVFAITLEETRDAGKLPPNIYLGATSAFGLHIVRPDADGDGQPDRTKTGAAGATWMAGMFAEDKGGSPGAIWRVDGTTGETKLFATLPANSGPGVGDIIHDKEHGQFFASDLDSGLLHRIDANGQLIDTFDHGVTGRPAKGLAAIADDGKKADITSAAFDVEKPGTWGFTQKERRVHGLALRDGRLFYAVDRQVWSIGIRQDGGFADDARWELDVETTTPDQQLSDMLFDKDGRLYVAERGAQRGSYDFSLFAEAEKAEVKRYRLEMPDDPATPSRWVAVAETYAVGLPAEHKHSNGGITLGFDYDETGMLRIGSCGAFLWTTGERLRAGEFAQGDAEGDPAANADVHGLQGNVISLVRPENVPPKTSYFTDYDSFFGDAEKAGHMGDVEIWQPCDAAPQTFGDYPPGWIPPGDIPPGFPETFPDPEIPFQANLELKKRANPKDCFSWGGHWICRYQVRVRNTGPDNYFGDILVRDWFPANPPGLVTAFANQPPWTCWQVGGPADTRCWRPDVFLAPGNSVFLTVWAAVPKDPRRCRLTNVAEIEWAPGGSQWNTDPTDDRDGATAIIPDPRCEPKGDRSNLKLKKEALKCVIVGNDVSCGFHVSVENTGPDDFLGPITVRDQLPGVVTSFSWAPMPNWDCANLGGNTYECKHKAPVNVFLAPTDKVHLWISARVPIPDAKVVNCKLPNRAWIASPLGAPKNTNPADDADSATADMPAELCREKETNLRLEKTPATELCSQNGGDFFCKSWIRVFNDGPGVYSGNLHVRDTFPAGTTLLLGPGPWACDPPIGNTRLCKLNGINMPKNTARSFPVWLKVPLAVARQHECRIRNLAKIVVAPGGTPQNTNPADDEDDAVSAIPKDVCDRPEPRSNLKLTKMSAAGPCSLDDLQNSTCSYLIKVELTTPGPFNGPIQVLETAPAGANISVVPGADPWTCDPQVGNTRLCKLANAVLPNQGSSTEFEVKLTFTADEAKQIQCKARNVAEITLPLGAPKNFNAADDKDDAVSNLPAHICSPPVPRSNLKITKRGPGLCPREGRGFKCDWTIDVENTGPGDFNGNIILNETLPGEPVDASWNAPWNCVGGGGGGGGAICTHNNAAIAAGGHLQLKLSTLFSLDTVRQLQCHLTNLVEIAQPAGNTPKNTDSSDDTAQATANVDAAVCQTFPPPAPQQCPPGYEFDDGQCVPKNTQCPSGWTRTPVKDKCCPPGERWNGRTCSQKPIDPPGLIDPIPPVIPPVTCPFGMNEVSSLRAHYLREQGWTVRRLPGLWCVKPPRETPCPPGFEQVPQSRLDILRQRGWVLKSVGHGKWCGKPDREPPHVSCPSGMEPVAASRVGALKEKGWSLLRLSDGKWCGRPGKVPPVKECPDGTYGKYPDCKRRPPETHKCWNGDVLPIGKKCPPEPNCESKGLVGKWPNCHRKEPEMKTCPDGSKVPVAHKCPVRPTCEAKGMTGKWPNCKPIIKHCPEGTVGKYPNCKKIVRHCPEGTVGKYPNCRKIVRPCPPGTFGKYPNCKRIVKIERKKPQTQIKRPPTQQIQRTNKPVIR